MKGNTRYTPAQRAEAIKAFQEGMNVVEISKLTGIPKGTISSWGSLVKFGKMSPDGTYLPGAFSSAPISPQLKHLAPVHSTTLTLDEY